MEWFILLVVIIGYCDLNSNIKKILNNQNKNNKKELSLLKKLIGKKIEIESDDEYVLVFGTSQKGILKEFNEEWLVLESEGKKGKELIYYRLNNIKGVEEIE